MPDDARPHSGLYLQILEAGVIGAGLSVVPDVSMTAKGLARTTGQTEDGRVVWLESTEYNNPDEDTFGRLVDYVFRAPINRALPANLEIRPWKSVRISRWTSKVHGKGKFEPVPPEGTPVKGVRASEPSEVATFGLSSLKSNPMSSVTDWPVVTPAWTEKALPRFTLKADSRANAVNDHTEGCTHAIRTVVADADTFTKGINWITRT